MTEDNWVIAWITMITTVFPVLAMATISEDAGAFVFVIGVGGSWAAMSIMDRLEWRRQRLAWELEHRNDEEAV